MRLVFILSTLLMASSNSWATESKMGKFSVINCVDGSLTVDPEAYVNTAIEEWLEHDEFAGIALGFDSGEVKSNAALQAFSFFTSKAFTHNMAKVIKDSTLVEIIKSKKAGSACMVKRGLITEETSPR